MKWLWLLIVTAAFSLPTIGCEIHGDTEVHEKDHPDKITVEVDKD